MSMHGLTRAFAQMPPMCFVSADQVVELSQKRAKRRRLAWTDGSEPMQTEGSSMNLHMETTSGMREGSISCALPSLAINQEKGPRHWKWCPSLNKESTRVLEGVPRVVGCSASL